MKFTQIHQALSDSAKFGEIRQIVRSFIDHECVLSAKTIEYAHEWLNYSPKDADLTEDGVLPTFSDMIHAAVNQYCLTYINKHYSGELPAGYDATKFLSHHESRESYDSSEEFEASADIYSALNNDSYGAMAIDSIYFDNWKSA